MELSFTVELYRLNTKLAQLVKNRRVKSIFVANQKFLFQISSFLPRNSFCVVNSFNALLVDSLARWLFTRETFGDNSATVNGKDL